MNPNVKIQIDEVTVPWYAVHADGKICGFFGPFRFLSNFYPVETGIWLDELLYPSVENAYQAAKYPEIVRKEFINITPGKAKRMGAQSFLRINDGSKELSIFRMEKKKWDKMKVELMRSLIFQKFNNDPKLRKMLLMTEDAHIEERNGWKDRFWGTDEKGEGENILGKMIMAVRDKIVAMEKKTEF